MTIHFINNPCVFLRCTEADNLEGDIGLHCVRLSNLILANMVTFLLLMAYYRPKALVVMEQPKSSWLFKQVRCLEVIWRLNMEKYLTYMGSWGGLLLKGTHLMSNFSLKAMVRKCTKKLKEKVAQRVEAMNRKRVAAGKPKKVFWVRTPDKKFHGGKDLASTAIYPKRFARAVFKCWLKA